MMYVLIAIVIVVVAIYLGAIFYQRTNTNRIVQLNQAKEKLTKSPVATEIGNLRAQQLSGASLKTFTKWSGEYDRLTKEKIGALNENLDEAAAANDKYQFIKTHRLLKEATETLENTQADLDDIGSALKDIAANAKANQDEIQKLEGIYQELRKHLLTKNFSYGPAEQALKDQLDVLEKDHDKAKQLANSGDQEGAANVLSKLETETAVLQDQMKRIPPRYNELANEFPAQITEIEQTNVKMQKAHFNFLDRDLDAEIAALKQQIATTTTKVAKLQCDAVDSDNKEMESQIDSLYAVMEQEIDARQAVEQKEDDLSAFIKHADKQNRELQAELNHLTQSYDLTHDELSQSIALKDQIDQLNNNYEADLQKIADQTAVYSVVNTEFQDFAKQLTEIEKKQQAIHKNVAGLHKGEQVAQNSLQQFVSDMRTIKREVEELRLPGLPKDYLDFFFVVSDEIKKLGNDLNQVKINLDDISKQLILTQQDINKLKQETNDLIDSALLTEQLLQYANRYRHSHPDVEAAVTQTHQLFDQKYEYKQAVDTIATALNKVEPGAYKKVEQNYYDQKQADLF
ncbi:septation ring formation regulator EzrA [Lactobacillus selangorensis]|nr:septation ring formation regulator EzrA [Lactobacillus selangorensis]